MSERLPGDYAIRRIDHTNPEDRAQALALLREYFASTPGNPDADVRYDWLYLKNPSGAARTYVACAKDSGAAVGITSLFPRAVQVDGVRATGAIGGDGYVTPAFRRRGIVTLLHQRAHAEMNGDLSFMFGPPEPNNLRALLQSGACIVGGVRRFVRPLKTRSVVRRPLPGLLTDALDSVIGPRSSTLQVELLGDALDPRVDEVWRAASTDPAVAHDVLPICDAAHYAWRFGTTCPQRGAIVTDNGRPIGCVALERLGGQVAVVDITCPSASFGRVLQAILHACRRDDMVSIQIHVPSRRKELRLLTSGFLPREGKPFQVQLPADHPNRATLTRPAAWHYMWGDGDVIDVLL
jgi:hypothetical protein